MYGELELLVCQRRPQCSDAHSIPFELENVALKIL